MKTRKRKHASAHAIIPVLRPLGHANGRHEDQLRDMLWMLQRVHGGEVTAHTAADRSHNGARAVQAVWWRQHLWPANTNCCKPRSRRMPSKPCDKTSNTGGNATRVCVLSCLQEKCFCGILVSGVEHGPRAGDHAQPIEGEHNTVGTAALCEEAAANTQQHAESPRSHAPQFVQVAKPAPSITSYYIVLMRRALQNARKRQCDATAEACRDRRRSHEQ